MVKKRGQMGANTPDVILMDRKTDMEFISGQTGQNTMENGLITKLMAKDDIHGLMGGCLWGSGRIIICMDMGRILGKTVENIKVNIHRIKSMGREHICGPMDGNT